MISIDTNLLLPALDFTQAQHAAAAGFIESLQSRRDVAISEFILLELYGLLRNPAVLRKPLKASRAADVCEAFRNHPRWQVLGFPPDSRPFHDALWAKLRTESMARRRAYDMRVALALVHQGVTEFATVNVKDFHGLGFQRVWNPLEPA